jgi:hypothetical protein
MKKKAFGQFFQARCPKKKRIFPWGGNKMVASTMFYWGEGD